MTRPCSLSGVVVAALLACAVAACGGGSGPTPSDGDVERTDVEPEGRDEVTDLEPEADDPVDGDTDDADGADPEPAQGAESFPFARSALKALAVTVTLTPPGEAPLVETWTAATGLVVSMTLLDALPADGLVSIGDGAFDTLVVTMLSGERGLRFTAQPAAPAALPVPEPDRAVSRTAFDEVAFVVGGDALRAFREGECDGARLVGVATAALRDPLAAGVASDEYRLRIEAGIVGLVTPGGTRCFADDPASLVVDIDLTIDTRGAGPLAAGGK